jgi:hypothetical protein
MRTATHARAPNQITINNALKTIDALISCRTLQVSRARERTSGFHLLPNVKDEPRAPAGEPLSSNDKARSSALGPSEIAAPVSALALAAGWALSSFAGHSFEFALNVLEQ